MTGSIRRLAARLLMIVGLAVAASAPAAEPRLDGRRDCAVVALRTLGESLGRVLPPDAVERALGPPGPDGHSLAQIARAGRSLGIPLDGRLLWRRDLPPATPVIIHLAQGGVGHFAVLRPREASAGLVEVLDPPHPPFVIGVDALIRRREWTGKALVPDVRGGGSIVRRAPYVLLAVALAAWAAAPRRPSLLASGRGAPNGTRPTTP